MLVGFVTAVLLLVSVTTFGGYVLSGVVEEKTSAIIELLLSHVRAYQLLAGKVLGIGTVALVQMAVAVAAGAVALGISGASIPVEIWVAVPTTLLWFVAGFVLYSTLFALAGSFVSRQEDAQAAAAPISLTFMAAYFIVFTVGTDPELDDGHRAVAAAAVRPTAHAATDRDGVGSVVGDRRVRCAAARRHRPRAAGRRRHLRPDAAPSRVEDHVARGPAVAHRMRTAPIRPCA